MVTVDTAIAVAIIAAAAGLGAAAVGAMVAGWATLRAARIGQAESRADREEARRAYWLSEESKEKERARTRTEARYTGLMRSLRGLQTGGTLEDRQTFVTEWYQCWLYCPDHIILAGRRFLDAVDRGEGDAQDRERAATLADFLIAIRREMGIMTQLTGGDFRLLTARPNGFGVTRPPPSA